jgi:hypothetical protein
MLKITIDWTFTSPVLKVAIGILSVEDINMKNGHTKTQIIKCKVKKEQGILGFETIDTCNYHIFEELRDKIETMVQSYYYGMILESHDFSWIDDSADITFDEWVKKRGLDKKQERIKYAKDTRVNF